MNFASILFLFFFLPTVLAAYFIAPRILRPIVLTLFSYAFYAWSDPRFVLLLMWTTVVDYSAASIIGSAWGTPSLRLRRATLGLSLSNSIGLLLWFKYAGFAQQVAVDTAGLFGYAGWAVRKIVLPAGISFYTFESISYVVDVYRGVTPPAVAAYLGTSRSLRSRLTAELRALVDFACYLAQFPHLIAGPIIRYQELAPQLRQPRQGVERFARGVQLFSIGLAKKVLIADTLAPAVDAVFSGGSADAPTAWFGMIAFAFQIYFDFSGYTDMARGMAMMLGFRFPANFASPYRAVSVTDFWRRWHMTLSRWLRDYIYIPLGGSRAGKARTYCNLMITMLLAGLWHGAGWNFIFWGGYHGGWLAIERWLGTGQPLPGWRSAGRRVMTFVIVCVGWLFFRAPSVALGLSLVGNLIPGSGVTAEFLRATIFSQSSLAAAAVGALIVLFGIESQRWARRISLARIIMAIACLAGSAFVLCVRSSTPFLYFKF